MKLIRYPYIVFSFLLCQAVTATDLYDSLGFETHLIGPIVGQSATPGSYVNGVGSRANKSVQSGAVFGRSQIVSIRSTDTARELLRHVFAGGGISAPIQYVRFKFLVDGADLQSNASLFTVRGELTGGDTGSSIFRISSNGVIYSGETPLHQVDYQSNVWEDFTLKLDLSVIGDTKYTLSTSQGSITGFLGKDYSVIDSFEWDVRAADGESAQLFIDNYSVSSSL